MRQNIKKKAIRFEFDLLRERFLVFEYGFLKQIGQLKKKIFLKAKRANTKTRIEEEKEVKEEEERIKGKKLLELRPKHFERSSS